MNNTAVSVETPYDTGLSAQQPCIRVEPLPYAGSPYVSYGNNPYTAISIGLTAL